MMVYAVITLLLFITPFSAIHVRELPEENIPVPKLVKFWGYPIETHEAKTADGYFLTLHRIPHGKTNQPSKQWNYVRTRKNGHIESKQERKWSGNETRPVVFLQHGLLCSSSNWVTNPPNSSLAYLLADAGYDVWMGNVRGNTYSRKHETLSPKSKQFWAFSFDEMSAYDLPAMIMYALRTTSHKSLYYVGHSQGTMMIFAGLSINKVLQKRIKVVFALAPVTRVKDIYSPIRYLTPFETEMKMAFDLLGIYDFLPSNRVIRTLADKMCPIDEKICSTILFLIAGYDKKDLNMTRIPVYFTHTPAGTSVKNMYHFSQLVRSGLFRMYDYGRIENLIKYGSFKPPIYHFNNIETPMTIISGSSDWLATPKDVEWTVKQLPRVIETVEIEGYNHLDFIWGLSAKDKVYRKIIKDIAYFEEHDLPSHLV